MLTKQEIHDMWGECSSPDDFAAVIERAVLAKVGEEVSVGRVNKCVDSGIAWNEGYLSLNDGDYLYAHPLPALPDGYATAPLEPTDAMIDAGVAMALQVSVDVQDGWSKYITGLYKQMLAARPKF